LHAEERQVAEPGFRSVAPGSGEIMMPPVSVCHQVSTIGQRPSPTTRWYQLPGLGVDRLADGAEQRSDLREVLLHRLVALAHQRADRGRRGVEDVTWCLSMTSQKRAGVG
jgi:hypothetical protein